LRRGPVDKRGRDAIDTMTEPENFEDDLFADL
jgi:hypothetical protein